MPSLAPRQVDNEALDILNRAIEEKRALSEFECARVTVYLHSLEKANSASFDAISACYFSQIADIDNLLISVSNAFERGDDSSYFNLIYALNNAMRYKEAYHYIKSLQLYYDNHDFLISAIKSCSFCGDLELSRFYIDKYSRITPPDEADDFLSQVGEVNGFLSKNNEIKEELSSYLIDCFDVFSRSTLAKTKHFQGTYGYENYVLNDEGYEFLSFSFIFGWGNHGSSNGAIESGDIERIEYIIDAEDDFISKIAKIKYSPAVKTKISFNFELGSLR